MIHMYQMYMGCIIVFGVFDTYVPLEMTGRVAYMYNMYS
jgi:hypothetical protein